MRCDPIQHFTCVLDAINNKFRIMLEWCGNARHWLKPCRNRAQFKGMPQIFGERGKHETQMLILQSLPPFLVVSGTAVSFLIESLRKLCLLCINMRRSIKFTLDTSRRSAQEGKERRKMELFLPFNSELAQPLQER